MFAGLVGMLWFYVGNLAYFTNSNGMTMDWKFAALIAVGLGAGSTAGDNLFSIFIEGIKGYLPTMIKLSLVAMILSASYVFLLFDSLVSIDNLIKMVASCPFISGIFQSTTAKSNGSSSARPT